jgi:two-component system, sensor histidine kinase and response regulator
MRKIFQTEDQDKKPLILIVDDIAKNIQVVANILGKDDYDISVALNGRQALSIMEKVRPDLILLDVMMPDIDGYEVCRRLKKDRRTDSIPVIFLTAKSDKEDIVKGFRDGCRRLCFKTV